MDDLDKRFGSCSCAFEIFIIASMRLPLIRQPIVLNVGWQKGEEKKLKRPVREEVHGIAILPSI